MTQPVLLAPISAAQVGMVWYEHFAAGSFNMSPLVRRYRGPLDAGALEAVLAEIVARHVRLRATFTVVDGHGVQRFSPVPI
ncbi:MAG: hypothetical protein ACRDZ8_11140 [Acidimicrobiales bacterium]